MMAEFTEHGATQRWNAMPVGSSLYAGRVT